MKKIALEQPKKRSNFRLRLGMTYYGLQRRMSWIAHRRMFAKTKELRPLPHLCFSHRTPLLRELKDVDMWMQHNKVKNLNIAVPRLNGVLLRHGEVFSYWKLIGKPTARKGYVEGMVLRGGEVHSCVGGGLCQLSNLIFWMTLHTPLTVMERHRHGYDVFPDSNRTQPFGSGATCYYPHGDLMIRNDTPVDYQLLLRVGEEYLEGEWRTSSPPQFRYEVEERNHEMRMELWGAYSRHNELYQKQYSMEGEFLGERLAVQNAALMTYAPFIDEERRNDVYH